MLKLREWNEVLAYADEVEIELKEAGLNAKAEEYLMYDGRQGINLIIYDNRGNVFAKYSSGIHDTVEEYKRYINYYKNKILNEC